PDPRWNNTDLNALRSIPGSAFEAVDASSLRVSSTSYAVAGTTAPPPPPPPPPPVTTTTPAPSPPPPTQSPAPPPPPAPAASPPPPAPVAWPPSTTKAPPAQPLATTGFETDLAGWRKGNSSTTLSRTCAVAHGGRCSAVVSRRGSAGTAQLDATNIVSATTP